jgi:small subunit ribosomal protein S2
MATEETLTTKPPEDIVLDEETKAMVDAGVFYGRKRSKTHPKMKQYIAGNRNEIEIINLQKTGEMLEAALNFLKETAMRGGAVLFVGTQPAALGIAALAKGFGYPVVTNRWLGGTLTNFKVISKRIEYYKKLKGDWEKNAFENYTKKERLVIERELHKLDELLSGLETLIALPAAMVLIDPAPHQAALREARLLKIPIVSLLSTDADPESVDYPVPGNCKAQLGINWFLGKVGAALESAKQARVAEAAKKQAEQVVPAPTAANGTK